jgi:hypothetical protein
VSQRLPQCRCPQRQGRQTGAHYLQQQRKRQQMQQMQQMQL